MEIKLQKWGNSDGIRIPSSFLKTLDIKTNDKLELIQEDNKIIISKKEKKHYTFEERIENFSCAEGVEEYDWGEPKGKELW